MTAPPLLTLRIKVEMKLTLELRLIYFFNEFNYKEFNETKTVGVFVCKTIKPYLISAECAKIMQFLQVFFISQLYATIIAIVTL